VTITFGYDDVGFDEDAIDIYFFNKYTIEWEPQGAVCDTVLNECTLTVYHFSDYIIGAMLDADHTCTRWPPAAGGDRTAPGFRCPSWTSAVPSSCFARRSWIS